MTKCVEWCKQNRAWLAAFAAAGRSMTFAMLIAYQAWMTSVKDQWDALPDWEVTSMHVLVALAALNALESIMNGSWGRAREVSASKQTTETGK